MTTTLEPVKENAIELWKRSESWGDSAQIQELLTTLNEQLADQTVSERSYKCVAMQMEEQGLEGSPYLHTRTFNGWRSAGRQVRKGEKSTIQSITWIGSEDDSRRYPKAAYLFHLDQTNAIEDFTPTDEPKKEYVKRERKPKAVTASLAVNQPGVTVEENLKKGGIEIKFSDRPSPEVLAQLKANSFRWSSANGCWYSRINDNSKVFAYSLQA